MRPCDIKTINECQDLQESGIAFNSRKIEVDSSGVYLTIEPHTRVKFSHKIFKRFTEWYLEDQERE